MIPSRPDAFDTTTTTTPGSEMTDSPQSDDPTNRDGVDLTADEATSAADADWLAELRATARHRNTTLADVVTDIEDDDDGNGNGNGNDRVDAPADEVTTGSPAALDEIRRFAREERERTTATPAPTPSPAPDQAPAPTPAPARTDRELPATRVAPPAPEMPPEIRPTAPRLGGNATRGAVPRWEAPPRLEAAAAAEAPGALGRARATSGTDWRLTVLAVAVALLLGVVITLLFLRDGATEPIEENPDDTTLVDGSPVPAAPADPADPQAGG